MSIPFRVGQGFDVHALVEGRPLIIGGVTIPHTHGLLGHSDADVLLREAMARVRRAGWVPVNIDATLHAQAPKIGPHAPAMVTNIAADLGLAETEINIKAKTNEGLGYLGRKEGIAATVVALLART